MPSLRTGARAMVVATLARSWMNHALSRVATTLIDSPVGSRVMTLLACCVLLLGCDDAPRLYVDNQQTEDVILAIDGVEQMEIVGGYHKHVRIEPGQHVFTLKSKGEPVYITAQNIPVNGDLTGHPYRYLINPGCASRYVILQVEYEHELLRENRLEREQATPPSDDPATLKAIRDNIASRLKLLPVAPWQAVPSHVDYMLYDPPEHLQTTLGRLERRYSLMRVTETEYELLTKLYGIESPTLRDLKELLDLAEEIGLATDGINLPLPLRERSDDEETKEDVGHHVA